MGEELFELCKEVYKRFPDWVDTDRIYGKEAGKDWYITNFRYTFPKRQRIPLYTSDYLLEKLQPNNPCIEYVEINGHTSFEKNIPQGMYWRSSTIWDTIEYAGTPLKSLLKLTLALHEAGEL